MEKPVQFNSKKGLKKYMKQRKLKGYVLPTLYVIVLMVIFGAVSLVSSLFNDNPSYLYTIGLLNGDATPVINADGGLEDVIIRPYSEESVVISKYFYDINGDEETQKKSLIYFENTYMKNTGVLYSADKEFQVFMVLDGTIADVREDNILGNVVEVEYSPDLRFIYYSLGDTEINKGDQLKQGEVIGVSGANNISDSNNNLLFEVYYKGRLIDPEEFYKMDVKSLS